MQVFICYSRADQDFAHQLVEDLTEYEVSVWMDVRSIPHGANWDMEVQKGLDASDILLVLLSPSSAASQNVADEWSYFIEKNKPILPLMIEPCEVPFRISRRQRVDFTKGYKEGFEELLQALGNPTPLDPEMTQKIRTNPKAVKTAPAAPATKPAEVRPATDSAAIKTLPVIWATSYHWFNGMGPDARQGDVMISPREMKLVPHASPITSIPMQSIVSAKVQRSVDHHLKITYYGQDGSFQSLVMMGAPKDRRKEIGEEVLNLLKFFSRRSLS